MIFLRKVDSGPRTNYSDFGKDPVQDSHSEFLNHLGTAAVLSRLSSLGGSSANLSEGLRYQTVAYS